MSWDWFAFHFVATLKLTDLFLSANLEISIRLMRDAKQPVGEPPVLAGPVAVPPLTEESAKRDPAVATVSRIRGISAAQVLQAKTVYNKIASAGREGVTLRTLEDQLPEINVGEALAALLRTKLPGEDGLPVVARVGFESVIYVTHAHFAEWNVDITTEEDLADNKRHLVPPRLWYDIEGGVVDKVLRMCRDAVTSMVVSRPGISFVSQKRARNYARQRSFIYVARALSPHFTG